MANITVTNTFTNGTTADATEVNANFTDIINGTSDGTKDFSISALTVAGAATLNGNVTLGNSSGDDVTITGSLAASIPIKTTNSFDIGSSTIGLQSIYFGSGDSDTTRLIGASTLAASVTLTLPDNDGAAGEVMVSNGSGVLSFLPFQAAMSTYNIAIANATTTNANDSIKVTSGDHTALSATNPGYIMMHGVTAGQNKVFEVTSDVTLDLTGIHGGFGTNGDLTDQRLYVYALNNAGSIAFGVGFKPDRITVPDTDDDTTQANISSYEKVLVNTALTADAQALQIGHFKANFDDTGGAAEDLWTVQTGDGDINTGAPSPRPRKVIIRDEKAAATAGGTFTTGDWRTRDLNVAEGDLELIGGDATPGSNNFTLKPGRYIIEAYAPAYGVGLNKCKLRNTTDSTDDLIGSAEYSSASQVMSRLMGTITLTASKTFEIQHRCVATQSTDGFGRTAGFSVTEVYTMVIITEISAND